MEIRTGLKYCGGCKSSIDRKKHANELQKQLGIKMEHADINKVYDRIYVVCGCSTCCPDMSGYRAKEIIFNHESFTTY